jgi:hypothetical protein
MWGSVRAWGAAQEAASQEGAAQEAEGGAGPAGAGPEAEGGAGAEAEAEGGAGVHLVTADGSVCCASDWAAQEQSVGPLKLAEVRGCTEYSAC